MKTINFKLLLLLALLFTIQTGYTQQVVMDQMILTSDGDSLATNIFIPEGEGPFPVILMRTPYDKNQRRYEALFNAEGYVLIIQDVRGRVRSTGQFRAWIDEELDGIETLDWIVNQKWCNGNIGLIGSSYSGYAAMQLAGSNHPSVKAIVNNSGPINLYDVIFPGGVFHATALFPWTMAFTHNSSFNFPPYKSGYDMNQLVRNLPLNKGFKKNGYEGTFWNFLVNHQTEDTYWDKINLKNIDRISIPILHVTGWYDFISTSALDGYQNITQAQKERGVEPNQHLWVGPWIHDDMINGGTSVGEIEYGEEVKVGLRAFLDQSILYFDRYLKSEEHSEENMPSVRYFEMGSNEWRTAEEWPATQEQLFYLSSTKSQGILSSNQSTKESQLSFKHDPLAPVETNGGANIHFPFFGDTNGIRTQDENNANTSLTFKSEPLTKDMHVFGKVKAKVFVSTAAQDADIAIKLNQIDKEGKITNIVDGIQRLSLSQNRRVRSFNSTEKASEVEVDLGYISILIPEGYSLSLEVSATNYPKYGMNPGTKANALTTTEFQAYEQHIHFSEKEPSRLIIPIR